MKFYTSDGCIYEGMDEETIIRLRAELGRSTEFVSTEAYEEIVRALGAL